MSASSLPVVGAHLRAGEHREQPQCREGAELEPARHLAREFRPCGGVKDALRVPAHPAIPEERIERGEIEQRWGVSRNEHPVGMDARRSQSACTLADGETASVAGSVGREMAGHAGDVAIAAQNLVERQRLAEADQCRPNRRRPAQCGDAARRGQLANETGQGVIRRVAAGCQLGVGWLWGGRVVATGGGQEQCTNSGKADKNSVAHSEFSTPDKYLGARCAPPRLGTADGGGHASNAGYESRCAG